MQVPAQPELPIDIIDEEKEENKGRGPRLVAGTAYIMYLDTNPGTFPSLG